MLTYFHIVPGFSVYNVDLFSHCSRLFFGEITNKNVTISSYKIKNKVYHGLPYLLETQNEYNSEEKI